MSIVVAAFIFAVLAYLMRLTWAPVLDPFTPLQAGGPLRPTGIDKPLAFPVCRLIPTPLVRDPGRTPKAV